MTDPRLSRGGAERFQAESDSRRASRGPNPKSVTLTADGAILRYKPEDIGMYKGVEFFAQDCEWEVGREGEDIEYPYVDGGTEEDTGRAPWKGTITAKFFGTNWLRRAENFIGVIEASPSPGDLQLPGGFARINAKIRKGRVRKLAGRGGCEMTLTFSEISFQAFVYMYDASMSPATRAEDLAAGTSAEDAVSAYSDTIRDPDASLEDQMVALSTAERALDAEDVDADQDTPAGQETMDRTALCRSSMYDAYPDQNLLDLSQGY